MRKSIYLLSLLLIIASCKSTKVKSPSPTTSVSEVQQIEGDIPTEPHETNAELAPESENDLVILSNEIIDYAKQFEGVRYKYGGTTKSGMDCSGLVYECFGAYNIALPRSSRDMASKGTKIAIEDVQPGDLLFFETNPKRKTINHVGLVISARTGSIEFIHSTTSKGVITSSLAEKYWYYSFKEARRIL
ncbi:C40 family peptidase [Formosa sp. S-31]|uniref:C40 family peptidase n=1 Tax=Formosa sp. S-31 TaxID=2790949 RepID=UPI003EBD73D1